MRRRVQKFPIQIPSFWQKGRCRQRDGAPKVRFGTKCPSMISTCSQSAPWEIVVLHASPRAAKSAERMDGEMMAGGDIVDC